MLRRKRDGESGTEEERESGEVERRERDEMRELEERHELMGEGIQKTKEQRGGRSGKIGKGEEKNIL